MGDLGDLPLFLLFAGFIQKVLIEAFVIFSKSVWVKIFARETTRIALIIVGLSLMAGGVRRLTHLW